MYVNNVPWVRIPLSPFLWYIMQVVGIHRDASRFYCALLSLEGKEARLLSLFETEEAALHDVLSRYRGARLVAGLGASDVLLRHIEKVAAGRYRSQSIAAQEKMLSLVPEAESVIAHVEQEGQEGLSCLITKRSLVDAALATWKVPLDRLSAMPWALWRYLSWKRPSLTEAWILDVRAEEWSLLIVSSGQLRKVHVLPCIREELARAIASLKPAVPPSLCVTGLREHPPHFRSWVTSLFRERIAEDISSILTEEESLYAVAMGLALEECGRASVAVQFLQKEWISHAMWKRRGGRQLSGWLGAMGLLVGTWGGGEAWLRHQEQLALTRWTHACQDLPPLRAASSLSEALCCYRTWRLQESAHAWPLEEAPHVSDILAFLANRPSWQEEPPCQLGSFHYARKAEGNEVTVHCLIQAPSLERANALRASLQAESICADCLCECEICGLDSSLFQVRVSWVLPILRGGVG